MKVIFLDIDGVLNSNDWYVKTRGVGGYNGGDIDPECIERVLDLLPVAVIPERSTTLEFLPGPHHV